MRSRATVAPQPPGHLPALDGVRGIAVLIVIIHNSSWIIGESEHFLLKLTSAIIATGWIGVQLFFALSGFLITGILLDTRHRRRYFSSFYLRRTLRIFPAYYALIALTVFVAPLVASSSAWSDAVSGHHWSYWLYLSNWFVPFTGGIRALSHVWSLAVEEQFYLLWPLIVWLLPRRSLINLCVAVVVCTPLIRLGLRESGMPPITAYEFTIARWDALAAGALLAVMVREDSTRALLLRWQGSVVAAAALGLALLVGVQHGFHEDGFGTQVFGQSLVAILSVGLIAYVVQEEPLRSPRLAEACSWPWLRTVGKYSYAMYLYHYPIQVCLTPLLEEQVRAADTPWRLARLLLYLVVVLTLSFLAALVSWRLIERPFLDLKDRIAPRPV